jgi:hypothetical protein
MPKGDLSWAVNEIAEEVGPGFYQDNFGILQLNMALYEDLRPDQTAMAYASFQQYMEEQYEWDWEDNFDWDAYREWYDSQ